MRKDLEHNLILEEDDEVSFEKLLDFALVNVVFWELTMWSRKISAAVRQNFDRKNFFEFVSQSINLYFEQYNIQSTFNVDGTISLRTLFLLSSITL